MSFVEAFYSFNLDITNADTGRSAKIRLKTPRHPFESALFFYARLVAFCHAYEPELTFSQGLYEPSEPTIWRRDPIGVVTSWIEVGAIDARKLKAALRAAERSQANPHISVYLFDPEHVQQICRELRGSKTNWIEPVRFFWLEAEKLQALCETESTSARWTVTIVDSRLYLSVDGRELELDVNELNMWSEFQRSINNQE